MSMSMSPVSSMRTRFVCVRLYVIQCQCQRIIETAWSVVRAEGSGAVWMSWIEAGVKVRFWDDVGASVSYMVTVLLMGI